MRVRFRRFAAIAALLGVLSILVLAAASAQEDVAGEVHRRINIARAEAGLPPLERNPLLEAAAQGHANDVAQHGSQLGHRGSDGSNFRQRIARTGYPLDNVGENWAGYRSLDKIMDFWLNDPPHRRNILKAKYRDIGIGVGIRPNGGLIVVTDFGAGGAPVAARESAPQPQPEVAPQSVEPTPVPPELTPLPPPPPTEEPPPPEPTDVPPPPPTAVPTIIPTVPPPPTLVALVLPTRITQPVGLRARAHRIRLKGEAQAAYGVVPPAGDYRRLLMGGTLSVGGVVLLGIAMMGHRRYRTRLDE